MQESNAVANAVFIYGPFVFLAFVVIGSNPLFLVVAIAVLYLIGLSKLVISKCSLFRAGIGISFGPRLMSAANRRRYTSAYRFVALGVLINLASLLLYS